MAESSIQTSRRRWVLRGLLLLFTLLIVVLLLWGWRTYRHALALRDHATELAALDLETLDRLGPMLDTVQDDVTLLRRDLAIPLALAPHLGWLPRIGPTVEAAPTLVEAGDLALSAVSDVWRVLEGPVVAITVHGDAAGLSQLGPTLAAQRPELEHAAADMERALDLLATLDASALDPRLAEPLGTAQELAPLVRAGFDGLPLLPKLFADDPATWLLLAQNSDELRATGGFISSIGTLTLGGSLPALGSLEDSYRVENWDKAHPDPPETLRQHMGLDLWVTRDGNWWPDFATSAEAVAELYTLNQDEPIEGVVAVDMLGAARVIGALAPLELRDGTRVGRGQVLDELRQSWGLPEEALVTEGAVITATQPYTAIDVELLLRDKPGQVWFDAVELIPSLRPGENLVTNGSFEQDNDADGVPDGWRTERFSPSDGLVSDVSHSGARSVAIMGVEGEDKRLVQRIEVAGKAGDVFRASALSKAEGVPSKSGVYGLRIAFINEKGRRDNHRLLFPVFTHDWATAGTADVVGKWWKQRKGFINEIVLAAGAKLLNPSQTDWVALLTSMRDALDGRHVQLYSRDPELQAFFRRRGWAGALAEASDDYVLVVDSNVGYNKVTASIEQSISYAVDLDAAGGPVARLAVSYHNTSSKTVTACDKYVTYAPYYESLVEGCYWDYVRIYVPAGAELVSATGSDEPLAALDDGRDAQDRTVWATSLILKPGEARDLVVEYRLPTSLLRDGRYDLVVQKQAGTDAIPLLLTVQGNGLSAAVPTGLEPDSASDKRLVYETDLAVDRALSVMLNR